MELVFLLLFFYIASLVHQAAQKKRGAPPPRRRVQSAGQTRPAPEGPRGFRELIEEVRRSMEEAERRSRESAQGATVRYPEDDRFEEDDEVEERTSLETIPTVVSLEVEPHRPERVLVDHDDEMEEISRKRIAWAERYARGRRPADHKAFDQRIRAIEPVILPPASRAAELRKMMVWRELLDKPVALRDR